ncbi:MAG: four helix bundle protein [Patescibacteria group bacterium]
MSKFQNKLKMKADEYVKFVYRVTKKFPKGELYGSVSQWRRSTLSIILNYLEGYARKKPLVQLNFLEISYGSLKESKYLLHFSQQQNFITENDHSIGIKLAEEIGAMLWTEISDLEKSLKK